MLPYQTKVVWYDNIFCVILSVSLQNKSKNDHRASSYAYLCLMIFAWLNSYD